MSEKLNINNIFERILEIIPGFLIWFLILLPIVGSNSIPLLIINFIIVLSIYWLFRACIVTVGGIIGYIKYRQALEIDWREQCLKLDKASLPNPGEITPALFPKQLIVIANYGESYEILSRTISAITKQNYPRELLYLAVSIEERKAIKDTEYAKRGEYLKKDFGDFFGDRLMCFTHPDGVVGEAIGAAANRTWGTKNSVEELERRGESIKEFLITAPDGDITFHKEYFAALTYKWLNAEKRSQKYYQTAVYTFNNNYWDVPLFIRILSISLTIPILASSIMEKNRRETFSCYTLSLDLMKKVNYWDTSLGIDDTTFYWRPYMYLNADWHCEVFFIPLSADAIYDPKYLKNHAEQYKQYLRWGWGVISFPIGIKVIFSSIKISPIERITKAIHLVEVFVLSKVITFLIAFGLPLLLFFNHDLDNYVISFTAPRIISAILNITTIFLIPTAILKILLVPPKPKTMSWFKLALLLVIELPLNIVALLTFSFLPFVEATTRMMLGQEHAKQIKWSEKGIVKK
ncbi:MAG: hypothetical protein ABI721_05155 [Candidatus Dojkabacteria bacterium]